ncbi:hypothetical protein Baya_10882 [Bagarius yarrelli]|uniref:Putative WW-binding domain-containing protein n=1 Tax=Bagarius yarrelli TaxID=175774 RepID=A0A556V0Q4_BAGYA|nr:hypothetical protein Baya_10882 [Bagarius yarrelli]
MMKRRAENSSLQELHHEKKKKTCGSVCDAESEVEAMHAVAAPPALFPSLIGERRRKRSRCCEDYEEHDKTRAQKGKTTDTTDGGKKDIVSGANEMTSEEIKADDVKRTEAQRPDDNEDNLSAFNSFQFWRTPLPALDLSLLDATSSPELGDDSSVKDGTEDMET